MRDDSLPEALAGRMYLYNSDREKIIEYVESIVTKKLRELSEKELSELNPTLAKNYLAERKEFLENLGLRSSAYTLKSDAKVESPIKIVLEEVDSVDLDNVDVDDGDWDEDIG